MSTIQTTLRATPSRWSATVLTAAAALIAIGVAVLFLAYAGGGGANRAATSHPTPTLATRHPAPTYYPLIQYRGTGAAPAALAPEPGQMHGGRGVAPASAAQAHPTAPTSVSQSKSYGAVP